jgi:hypothetical protein
LSTKIFLEIMLKNGRLPRRLNLVALIKNHIEAELTPFITKHHYRKSQILLSKGHICNHLYMLEDGIVRGYDQQSESLKEQTHFLWNGHSIIVDPLSFYKRKPSQLTIETLTEVTLESISFST